MLIPIGIQIEELDGFFNPLVDLFFRQAQVARAEFQFSGHRFGKKLMIGILKNVADASGKFLYALVGGFLAFDDHFTVSGFQ